jgi:DNA-binding LacI/PurR family transcriptional regulator
VSELVRELAVSKATLNRAYDQLDAEGLLERRPRKGVFVADRTRCGDIAIVAHPRLLNDDAVTPFFRVATAQLIDRLHATDKRWNVRMHAGRFAIHVREFAETLDLLRPDVLSRLRAVFTFVPLFELEQRLNDARVPVVGLNSYDVGNSVMFSRDHFTRESVAFVARRGYRRVGVIARSGGVRDISQLAIAQGMESQPQWSVSFNYGDSESTAYEGFKHVWQSDDRLDVLITNEDVCARGVLRAAGELGVRFPEDMGFLTFSVRGGVELKYSKPLSRIEYDPASLVTSAVSMMKDLLAGRALSEKLSLIEGQVIEGETV